MLDSEGYLIVNREVPTSHPLLWDVVNSFFCFVCRLSARILKTLNTLPSLNILALLKVVFLIRLRFLQTLMICKLQSIQRGKRKRTSTSARYLLNFFFYLCVCVVNIEILQVYWSHQTNEASCFRDIQWFLPPHSPKCFWNLIVLQVTFSTGHLWKHAARTTVCNAIKVEVARMLTLFLASLLKELTWQKKLESGLKEVGNTSYDIMLLLFDLVRKKKCVL